jgi:hypothetical protein
LESFNQNTSESNKYKSQAPWWNRPLWGQRSLWEKLTARFLKESVPESTVFLHDRALRELTQIAPRIEGLNDRKFGSPEFILLLKLRSYFMRGVPGYEGLEESTEMLKGALEAKDSFLRIEETEFQFRSSAQQKFYQNIFDLLSKNLSQQEFQREATDIVEATIPKLKTEDGITAIRGYEKELNSLCLEHKLGLRLLYLFKQSDLVDFSILRKISNLVTSFQKEELHNYKQILVEIKLNYSLFEKLGKIIGITGKQNNPDTYAKMVQYIALMEKHKRSYSEFKQLLFHLSEWETPYQKLKTFREEYSPKEYKIPKSFREDLPGIELYEKYKSWLFLRQEN